MTVGTSNGNLDGRKKLDGFKFKEVLGGDVTRKVLWHCQAANHSL